MNKTVGSPNDLIFDHQNVYNYDRRYIVERVWYTKIYKKTLYFVN